MAARTGHLLRGTAWALCWALIACGGMTPAPRYAAPQGPDAVVAELERRQAARRGWRDPLRRVVDTYIGVPYKWGGTTRRGMDCSALVRAVYREAYGIELPRTSKQMYRLGQGVSGTGRLRPGDLVFFKIDASGPGISHVGVYLGDGRFAHASSSRGGTIERLETPYFRNRYAGARRVLN